MNRTFYILAATIMLLTSALAAHADNPQYMVITMSNGSGNMYLPLTDNPTLLVQGDLLEVQTSELSIGYINKNAVKHITYSDVAEELGIDAVLSKGSVNVDPRVTHATVTITGLQDAASISLYNTGGANCNPAIKRLDTSATVDMSALPRGVYILKVNKESFKIVKK